MFNDVFGLICFKNLPQIRLHEAIEELNEAIKAEQGAAKRVENAKKRVDELRALLQTESVEGL